MRKRLTYYDLRKYSRNKLMIIIYNCDFCIVLINYVSNLKNNCLLREKIMITVSVYNCIKQACLIYV